MFRTLSDVDRRFSHIFSSSAPATTTANHKSMSSVNGFSGGNSGGGDEDAVQRLERAMAALAIEVTTSSSASSASARCSGAAPAAALQHSMGFQPTTITPISGTSKKKVWKDLFPRSDNFFAGSSSGVGDSIGTSAVGSGPSAASSFPHCRNAPVVRCIGMVQDMRNSSTLLAVPAASLRRGGEHSCDTQQQSSLQPSSTKGKRMDFFTSLIHGVPEEDGIDADREEGVVNNSSVDVGRGGAGTMGGDDADVAYVEAAEVYIVPIPGCVYPFMMPLVPPLPPGTVAAVGDDDEDSFPMKKSEDNNNENDDDDDDSPRMVDASPLLRGKRARDCPPANEVNYDSGNVDTAAAPDAERAAHRLVRTAQDDGASRMASTAASLLAGTSATTATSRPPNNTTTTTTTTNSNITTNTRYSTFVSALQFPAPPAHHTLCSGCIATYAPASVCAGTGSMGMEGGGGRGGAATTTTPGAATTSTASTTMTSTLRLNTIVEVFGFVVPLPTTTPTPLPPHAPSTGDDEGHAYYSGMDVRGMVSGGHPTGCEDTAFDDDDADMMRYEHIPPHAAPRILCFAVRPLLDAPWQLLDEGLRGGPLDAAAGHGVGHGVGGGDGKDGNSSSSLCDSAAIIQHDNNGEECGMMPNNNSRHYHHTTPSALEDNFDDDAYELCIVDADQEDGQSKRTMAAARPIARDDGARWRCDFSTFSSQHLLSLLLFSPSSPAVAISRNITTTTTKESESESAARTAAVVAAPTKRFSAQWYALCREVLLRVLTAAVTAGDALAAEYLLLHLVSTVDNNHHHHSTGTAVGRDESEPPFGDLPLRIVMPPLPLTALQQRAQAAHEQTASENGRENTDHNDRRWVQNYVAPATIARRFSCRFASALRPLLSMGCSEVDLSQPKYTNAFNADANNTNSDRTTTTTTFKDDDGNDVDVATTTSGSRFTVPRNPKQNTLMPHRCSEHNGVDTAPLQLPAHHHVTLVLPPPPPPTLLAAALHSSAGRILEQAMNTGATVPTLVVPPPSWEADEPLQDELLSLVHRQQLQLSFTYSRPHILNTDIRSLVIAAVSDVSSASAPRLEQASVIPTTTPTTTTNINGRKGEAPSAMEALRHLFFASSPQPPQQQQPSGGCHDVLPRDEAAAPPVLRLALSLVWEPQGVAEVRRWACGGGRHMHSNSSKPKRADVDPTHQHQHQQHQRCANSIHSDEDSCSVGGEAGAGAGAGAAPPGHTAERFTSNHTTLTTAAATASSTRRSIPAAPSSFIERFRQYRDAVTSPDWGAAGADAALVEETARAAFAALYEAIYQPPPPPTSRTLSAGMEGDISDALAAIVSDVFLPAGRALLDGCLTFDLTRPLPIVDDVPRPLTPSLTTDRYCGLRLLQELRLYIDACRVPRHMAHVLTTPSSTLNNNKNDNNDKKSSGDKNRGEEQHDALLEALAQWREERPEHFNGESFMHNNTIYVVMGLCRAYGRSWGRLPPHQGQHEQQQQGKHQQPSKETKSNHGDVDDDEQRLLRDFLAIRALEEQRLVRNLRYGLHHGKPS